jgi:spore germination cell wall hydrolase CwlJ-like protein
MGDGMLMTALTCLALNIYHEARSESFDGQYAVAHVVINRVQDHRWPDSICEVVKQHRSKRSCQFSWWCDGKSDKPKDKVSWQQIQILAYNIHTGFFNGIDLVQGATHYHANYVKPYWINNKIKVRVIADHVFYKWEK